MPVVYVECMNEYCGLPAVLEGPLRFLLSQYNNNNNNNDNNKDLFSALSKGIDAFYSKHDKSLKNKQTW